MKIEINKKGFFALLMLSASVAFGDYVTIVDSDSNGGYIVKEDLSERDISEILDRTMPIGSLSLRLDNINPADIYGGTWEIVDGDASLRLGNGNTQTGVSTGNNTPIVPVPLHSHSATSSSNTHSHDYVNPSYSYAGIRTGSSTRRFGDEGAEGYVTYSTTSDTHNHTITVANTGVNNATIDVRGKHLLVNVWKRTH